MFVFCLMNVELIVVPAGVIQIEHVHCHGWEPNVVYLTNGPHISLSLFVFLSVLLSGFKAFSREYHISLSGCFPARGRGQPVRIRDHSCHTQTLLPRYQSPAQRLPR